MPMDDASIAKLKELKELLDSGVLTQEEFDEQKKEFLEKSKTAPETAVMDRRASGAPKAPLLNDTDAGANEADAAERGLAVYQEPNGMQKITITFTVPVGMQPGQKTMVARPLVNGKPPIPPRLLMTIPESEIEGVPIAGQKITLTKEIPVTHIIVTCPTPYAGGMLQVYCPSRGKKVKVQPPKGSRAGQTVKCRLPRDPEFPAGGGLENQHPAIAACVLACGCCLTATGGLLWVLKLLILCIQVPVNLFCYSCRCACCLLNCVCGQAAQS